MAEPSVANALPAPRGPSPASLLLPSIFFLSGFAALIYQLCWQRLLFVSFGIDIESVTIIVSTFMLGLGVGALAGGRIADAWPSRLIVLFALCELGIGIFGLASVPLIQAVGRAFVDAERPVMIAMNFLLLLVPTSLMGATLPILVTDAVNRNAAVGASVGSLYFANTLGAASGAFVVGAGLFALVDIPEAVRVAAALNLLVASLGALLARFRS